MKKDQTVEDINKDKPQQISAMRTKNYYIDHIVRFSDVGTYKKTGMTANDKKEDITNEESFFVIFDRLTKEYSIETSFTHQGIKYIPSRSKLFDDQNSCLVFPSDIENYGSADELISEIRSFMTKYMQLDDIYEIMLPYFVLYTWIHDEFPFSIYVHFVGSTGTGKSRAIDVLSSLCYKGIRGSGSITTASLFRIVDQFQGTLFLNEFEMTVNEDGGNEKLLILKSGSENYSIFRTEGEKEKYVQKYFMKCPKVFGGEKEIADAGLESRTITIPMKQAKRKIPLYLPSSFYRESEKLRNKLLRWRLDHLDTIDIDEMQEGYADLASLDKRAQQIMTPLYHLAGEKEKQYIAEYAKKMEDDTYQARRDSIGGRLFLIILTFYGMGNPLVLKDIAEEFSSKERGDYKPRKVAGIIRKELAIDIEEEGHDKVRTIQLKDERLKELCLYFGYSVPTPPAKTGENSPAMVRGLGLDYYDSINSAGELENDAD